MPGRARPANKWSQEAINDELVRRAQAGQNVVRLKSGDPMIFGRAAQEIEALAKHQIPFEVVPGVTAATAAAACAGVPITDRDQASAVAFITGQEARHKRTSPLDYDALARFPGTLVFYMGVTTATLWSQALIAAGKSPDTPVLIVRRCSWPDQQSIACSLADVSTRLTPYNRIPPPVIIIVGEVAARDLAFDWFEQQPLFGQCVCVTRPEHQAGTLETLLTELGAEVVLQPAIEISAPADWGPVDRAIDRLKEFDDVVFSSANGVRYFLERMEQQADLRRLGNCRLAAIGPATAAALAAWHLRADVLPAEFRAESLAWQLGQDARGRRFLLIRASRGRELLADELTAAGGIVEQVVAYESRDVTIPDETVRAMLRAGRIDWMTVTSSAIANSLIRQFGQDLHRTRLASISPITSATLADEGLTAAVEASIYTTDGLVQEILRAGSSRSPHRSA